MLIMACFMSTAQRIVVVTLGLFAGIIVLTFRGVGRIGRSVGEDRFHQLMAWALGAALLVHCANFLGVSYFGQIMVVWYLGLAMVGSLLPRTSAAVSFESRRLPAPTDRVARTSRSLHSVVPLSWLEPYCTRL